MKKILSILLVITLLFLSCGMTASAASNNDNINTIAKEFKDGEHVFDYCYYTPVKDASDTTKYPLIIWLHGQLSGHYPGYQVIKSDAAYFATKENQAKIKGTGGAFVLIPRDPTASANLAWNGEISDIKKLVDGFIADHKNNLDTNRIYVGGYSLGGKAAMKLAAAYPNYVAAIFPASSIYLGASANSDLKALINTPTWFFTCKEDNFWGKPVPQADDWSYFCSIANDKSSIRWTQFTRKDSSGKDVGLFNYDGSKILMIGYNEHNVWDPVPHDLIMQNGSFYPNMTTVDGFGTKVNLTTEDSFISWLSSHSLDGVVGEEGGNNNSGNDGGSSDNNSGSNDGNSGSNDSNSGSSGEILGSSGLVFNHLKEILEFIATLFDRVYKALFTII